MPFIVGIGLFFDFILEIGGVGLLENGEIEEISRITVVIRIQLFGNSEQLLMMCITMINRLYFSIEKGMDLCFSSFFYIIIKVIYLEI